MGKVNSFCNTELSIEYHWSMFNDIIVLSIEYHWCGNLTDLRVDTIL